MAKRKLPSVPVHQIKAGRQDDVNADGDQDIVVISEVRGDEVFTEKGEAGANQQGQEQDQKAAAHTFSRSTFPRMPVGLNKRITIKTAKAMPSRHCGKPNGHDKRFQDPDN